MADEYLVQIKIDAKSGPAVQDIDKVERKLKGLDNAARQGFSGANREAGFFQRGLSGLESALIGFGTALVTQIGINGVMQMRELGAEIATTRARFDALTGDGAAALDTLRGATGNVITDFELMQTTASAIMTGIASDATEAGRLISLGMALGGEEGVEKLFQALRNQSYLVLDSVGISASDVRALAEQYRAAGMDSAEAFNRAVIDVGEVTRQKLGEAANAGITAWDRVRTWFENEFQRAAEGVSGILETAAADLITAIDAHNRYWAAHPQNVSPQTGPLPINAPPGSNFGWNTPSPFAYSNEAVLQQLNREAQLRGVIAREAAYATWQRMEQERAITAMVEQREAVRQQAILASETRMDLLTRSHDFYYGTRDALGLGPPLYGREDTFTPFGASQLGDLKTLVEPAQAIRDALKEAYERGLVSADTVRGVESNLDTAIQLADEAERAQRAYERMTTSLSGLLGIDVTNPIGVEITDQVAQAMRDAGMDEEQIQAYIDAMDLSTGRQTALSQRFKSEVLPGIVAVHEQMGADAAREATLAFQRGLTMVQTNAWGLPDDLLQLSGYRIGDDGNVVSAGLGVVPDNVGAGGITPVRTREEATPFGQLLTEGDAVIAKAGEISTAFLQIPATIQPMTDSISATVGISETLKQSLDTMAGQDYELRFVLTSNDRQIPAWLKELIRNELVTLNRVTGGRSPGTDPRRSRTTN